MITKKHLLLVLLLCFSTLAFSKMTGNGYLVTTEKDTLFGTIDVFFTKTNNFYEHTYSVIKVDFYRNKKTKRAIKATYLASELEFLYFITNDGRGGSYYQKHIPYSKDTVLLKPVCKGTINLYRFEKFNAGMMGGTPSFGVTKKFSYVLETPTSWVKGIHRTNYVAILKRELKDCPELAKNIGRYRYGKIIEILKKYNDCVDTD